MTSDIVSTPGNYQVRPLTKQDTAEALNLLNASMPDSTIPKTSEFWEWKHFRNPFGVSPGLVAVSEGKIVGVRVFLRWTWRNGQDEVFSGRAVDTATHPEWQGKRIFSNLTNQLMEHVRLEGMKFIFNTPNRVSLPGYLKMGWRVVTRIPLWIRPLRPLTSLVRLAGFGTTQISSSEGDNDSTSLHHSEWIQELVNRSADSRLQTVRTAAYLQWRYQEIPGIRYSVKWKESGQAQAAIIFREKRRKRFQEISITELFTSWNDGDIKLAAEMLTEICGESKADYALATAALNTPERAVLQRSGFLPIGDRGPVLTARMLEGYEKPMEWSNWRCSLGDLELF